MLSTHDEGVNFNPMLMIRGVEPAAMHAPHSALLKQQQFIRDGNIYTNAIWNTNVPITITRK